MAVLFDLDQTLIDSQIAEALRNSRRWAEVYELIPQLRPYDGISDLLAELRALHVPICVVTASPRTYCARVARHWGWAFDASVCYHDTTRHKPFPDPILEGLRRLGKNPSWAIAVGDSAVDTLAARAAGVLAVGALWGSLDQKGLLESQPDVSCATVGELRSLF